METELPAHQLHRHWRISDHVFRGLSVAVVLLTWTLLFVAYPILPPSIPQHFNWAGVVDATTTKTWWSVFMPALLQTVLTILMWWVSYHPEYSNLPTSISLRAVPEPLQTKLRAILAHLMVMVGLLANLIFAYVALAIVRVGLGETTTMNGGLVLGLVTLLLGLTIRYAVWIARLIRQASFQSKPQG